MSVQLERALMRLLWRSIADAAECTCVPGDPCPECEATRALGLGRWDAGIGTRMIRLVCARPELATSTLRRKDVEQALEAGAKERRAAERTLKRSPRR